MYTSAPNTLQSDAWLQQLNNAQQISGGDSDGRLKSCLHLRIRSTKVRAWPSMLLSEVLMRRSSGRISLALPPTSCASGKGVPPRTHKI